MIDFFQQFQDSAVIEMYLGGDHGLWTHWLIISWKAFNEEEVFPQALCQVELIAWRCVFETFFFCTCLDVLIILKHIEVLIDPEDARGCMGEAT